MYVHCTILEQYTFYCTVHILDPILFCLGNSRETHPHLYTEHCWNVENRQPINPSFKLKYLGAESIECFIEDQACSRSYD
jgi:hypothetical protein